MVKKYLVLLGLGFLFLVFTLTQVVNSETVFKCRRNVCHNRGYYFRHCIPNY